MPTPDIAWNRIRWRQVPSDDPLSLTRTVTSWSGGYVALGRTLAGEDPSGRNLVWTSPDGDTWTQLPSGTFGSSSVVTSVAAIKGGVVALTLELSPAVGECEGTPEDLSCYQMRGPMLAWTSTDGQTWTSHPLTGIPVPPAEEMSEDEEEHPVLQTGIAPLLLLRMGERWLGVSSDGVTWERIRAADLPRRWTAVGAVAFRRGFTAAGASRGGAVALRSAHGSTWKSTTIPARCGQPADSESVMEGLAAGRDGLILDGSQFDRRRWVSVSIWCTSRDGRTWRVLDHYGPLQASQKRNECRGVCPNGIVVGDGTHLVAYRGYGTAAAWVSFDGRSWKRLRVRGELPGRWTDPTYPFTLELEPFGLIARHGLRDVTWVGTFLP